MTGVIEARPRKPGGRHNNERLRRAGLVPAVIYGHGEGTECIAIARHDLELVLGAKKHVLELRRPDGASQQYLIKDVEYDHLGIAPLHVDLMRVRADERVEVKVPIEFRGTAKGQAEGGVLVHVLGELHVECLLLAIPDSIRVNVSDLVIGSQLHVRDLAAPPGVRILHAPDDVVAVVRAAGVAVAETPAPVEGESAEPEVIGRVAKEKPEAPAEEKE